MSGEIQSILFNKNSDEWNNSKDRLKFLKKIKVKAIKRVHNTSDFFRYRIREPTYKNYKTFKLSPSVSIIYGI